MRSLILLAVTFFGLSSVANTFAFEGKWKAHCEWTEGRINEVVIRYLPESANSTERVELDFNPGKFVFLHDTQFNLFNEDYYSGNYFRYSILKFNQTGLEYRLRSNYGGKDSISFYLYKISETEALLSLSVNGSRSYEYKLTR